MTPPLPLPCSVRLPLGVLALSLPAAASAAPATWALPAQLQDSYTIDAEALNASIDASTAVWAEVSGNTTLDAAFLQGTTLTVSTDLGFTEASIPVSGSFTDVIGYGGELDPLERELITVGADGLCRIFWPTTGGAFDTDQLINAATDPNGHSVWVNAQAVRAADLDNDGVRDDLVGVSHDGRWFVMATRTGSTYTTTWSLIALTDPVVDLAVFDGHPSAGDETAILTSSRLYFMNSSGVANPQSIQNVAHAGDLAAIKNATEARERLAWLRPLNGGAWVLSVVNLAAGTIVNPVIFADDSPRRIAPGDYNGDGRTDVALTSRDGAQVRVMHQGSDGSFSGQPSASEFIDVENPPAGYTSAPAVLVDFDNDGDQDLVAVNAEAQTLFLSKNALVDHNTLAPQVLERQLGQEWLQTFTEKTADNTGRNLRVRVHGVAVPGVAYPVASPPAGATHLEARLWHTVAIVPGTEYVTDTEPIATVMVPLDATYDEHCAQVSYMETSLKLPNTINTRVDFAMYSLRFVEADNNSDTLVRSWPHVSFTCVDENNTFAHGYINGLAVAEPVEFLHWPYYDPWGLAICDDDVIDVDGTTVNTGGPVNCLPDFPPAPVEDEKPDEDASDPPKPKS